MPIFQEQKLKPGRDKRWLEGVVALALLFGVIVASLWLSDAISAGEITAWHVLLAASITAVVTGFGALPFLFIDEISANWLGVGNALATGLMLGASIGLIAEGVTLAGNPIWQVIVGIIIGVSLIYLASRVLEGRDEGFSIGRIRGANAIQMLMIVGVMTAHSFAEGVGIGVSFGDDDTFGAFISLAIAIHNIPEGLAISLILIPRGASVIEAGMWSIFSSLPQPLMAVPAFLFVLVFRQLLPVGLGLAAGAMLWMVFSELLPESIENLPSKVAYPLIATAVLLMLAFQYFIG